MNTENQFEEEPSDQGLIPVVDDDVGQEVDVLDHRGPNFDESDGFDTPQIKAG